MRKVIYYEDKRNVQTSKYDKEVVGEALFHQWGLDYEEFETGAGNYSVAILELESGDVITVAANLIKFVKQKDSKRRIKWEKR